MGKIKIILAIVVIYFIYKGFIAIKDFDLALTSKVQKIEEIAGVEKENQVIGLMMYTGYPLKLSEHLFMSSEGKCLKKKKIAEENQIPFLSRDIFLDNKKDLEYITNKFIELVAIAKKEGSALAIGHPHSNTIEILSIFLKEIDKYGVKLIGIKSLIKKRKN